MKNWVIWFYVLVVLFLARNQIADIIINYRINNGLMIYTTKG